MSIFTYNVVKLKIISDKVNNLYNFAQLNNSYPMRLSNGPEIWLKEVKYRAAGEWPSVFRLPTGEDLVALSETKQVFICLIPKN